MKEIITGYLAKKIDNYAINELKIPSLSLMENAAEAVFMRAKEALPADRKNARVRVFAGTGNNGADGVLCAVKLIRDGFKDTEVFYCGNPEKITEELKVQTEALRECGKPFRHFREYRGENMKKYAGEAPLLVIDALFGIGLKREVSGEYDECIRLMNSLKDNCGAYIISVDVPSGINSDNGKNMCKTPVKADMTVTFGYEKTGFYMNYGYENCGRIFAHKIGYPENITRDEGFTAYLKKKREREGLYIGDGYLCAHRLKMHEEADIKACGLSDRAPRANKSDYGKLVIAAGSKGMAGAAYLSGLAAYRTGAGMVKYLGPEENRVIIQSLLPEAMYESLNTRGAEALKVCIAEAVEWTKKRGCFVLGPGLSGSEQARELTEAVIMKLYEHNRKVLDLEASGECLKNAEGFEFKKSEGFEAETREGGEDLIYLVADGDALNIISRKKELLRYMKGYSVITPHIGEMSRITGKSIEEIKEDPVGISLNFFRETGIRVILKDYISVITENNEEIFLNASGNAALSKAGAGDVLTGILAALIMREGSLEKAVSMAPYIHGLSGSRASLRRGVNGVLARDIAEGAADVIREGGNA